MGIFRAEIVNKTETLMNRVEAFLILHSQVFPAASEDFFHLFQGDALRFGNLRYEIRYGITIERRKAPTRNNINKPPSNEKTPKKMNVPKVRCCIIKGVTCPTLDENTLVVVPFRDTR